MTDMTFGADTAPEQEPILTRWWQSVDRWTLAAILTLFLVGILLGLAASPPLALDNGQEPFFYVKRQLFFGGIGLTAMLIVSMLSPKAIRRWATLGCVIGLIALLALPVFGTDFGKGAIRWFSLGFFSVQPSEFMKPVFVVVAAWLMTGSMARHGPPGMLLSLALAVAVAGILVRQPDYGQASLILASWGLMYFVAGAPVWLLCGMASSVMAFGVFAYQNSEHVARRIDGYLNPDVDPRTQLGYAEAAIREGGFLGVGAGEGLVKERLPDAHTDFIIAVAAEEYGLVLVLLIIAVFLFIVVRALTRLAQERDVFVRLSGTGLAALFGMQAIINMGVAVRLLPAKGMTLPFVSYGGSSLLAAGLALGMLLAFTRKCDEDE
ncbi:peptidoglycan glycosyltransferase FtsW [Pontivivens insulae]|uniref:Probable peptidoglycan glycosyltransferase FtsW n=1 Tax=Pontivivens insulae TaxID=1639689 RepID=A0A2R8ADI1_9RHOB|nr:putative peptidoglycan glycosyltransferase FtsW [Pontivivens insulae]RED14221.1 cell division protein FtsW [Pontivivens insulae]SPF30296.1 putative peptidoglycan glycosyltransferase FtsW [Pontivivens insulae]